MATQSVWRPNIKELARRELKTRPVESGHRLCAGCGAGIIIRQIAMAARKSIVWINATGCVEVATTIFPYTSWNVPWAHNAFENAAAVASGVEAARKKLSRVGRFANDPDVELDYDIVVLGGDGGTYDIGIQSISGAFERRHKFMYVLYDNEAYMNTGIQRSGGTPFGARTTTTPVGKVIKGKPLFKKPIMDIIVAHQIPYAATISSAYWNDAIAKLRKGFEADGPAFIHAFSTCPLGWGSAPEDTVKIMRLAVETCVFPLYEVTNREYRLTGPSISIAKNPARKKPIEEYLKLQGRFRHMFKPENKWMIDKFQGWIDKQWEALLKRAGY